MAVQRPWRREEQPGRSPPGCRASKNGDLECGSGCLTLKAEDHLHITVAVHAVVPVPDRDAEIERRVMEITQLRSHGDRAEIKVLRIIATRNQGGPDLPLLSPDRSLRDGVLEGMKLHQSRPRFRRDRRMPLISPLRSRGEEPKAAS